MPRLGASRGAALPRLAALGLVVCLLRAACFAGGRGAAPAPRGSRALNHAVAAEEQVDQQTAEGGGNSQAAGAVAGGIASVLLSGGSVFAGLFGSAVFYFLLAGPRSREGTPATSAGFDPSNELGAMSPLGYWDPAGLMKHSVKGDLYGWEWKDEATFRDYRQAELKHGRLAMVAMTGLITAQNTRWEGFDGPNGWAAALPGGVEAAPGYLGVAALTAGIIELQNGEGDFDDPLGIEKQLGGAWGSPVELREKELAHGRLAMSGVFTLWLFEYFQGSDIYIRWLETKPQELVAFTLLVAVAWVPALMENKGEQVALVTPESLKAEEEKRTAAAPPAVVGGIAALLGTGGSVPAGLAGAALVYGAALSLPRRDGAPAFEGGFDPTNELGVIRPTGYWDPLGLMKKGVEGDPDAWEWKDEATFNKYRTAELKHGRLAMVALAGILTASATRFPLGDAFTGPGGLAARDTEIAGAIGIIFLAAGFAEIENGDGDFDDPLDVQSKLGGAGGDINELRNKELAHGRLAMSVMLTLWLVEYGAGYGAFQGLLSEKISPAAYVGFAAMLFFWVPYTNKESKEESTALVVAGNEGGAIQAL